MVCAQATGSHGRHSNASNPASILPLHSSAGVAPEGRTAAPAPVRYDPCLLAVCYVHVRPRRIPEHILAPVTRSLIQILASTGL